MTQKPRSKPQLLNAMEAHIAYPLDSLVRDLRARLLKRLNRRDLEALERGFLMAYQEGFERGEFTERER